MIFGGDLTFLSLFGVILTLVVISIRQRFKEKFSYWKRRDVPSSIPASIPFGNMTQQMIMRKTQAEIVAEQYFHFDRQGHKFGGVYATTRPVLIPTDPELIKTILVKEFTTFHDRVFANTNKNKNPLLTEQLFLAKGAKWRFLRTKLSPTFTSGKMKMMFNKIVECAKDLEPVFEKSLEKDEPIDIKDILARYTTDVIGTCAFGLECNSLKDPDAEFRKFGKKLFKFNNFDIIRRSILAFAPFLSKFIKFQIIEESAKNFFMNAIKQTVEYRERNHIERNDFMNLLIKLKNNESIEDDGGNSKEFASTALTFNQLAAQCFVFFVGGFDTSSTTMTYCLYELCKNENIQEKLRREIIETLEKYNGQLTYEGIIEMQYMDKVVKETLRKYPVVPVLQRECANDFKIPETNGLILEKGTAVFIPVFGLHRNPKYYPDPLKFNPERFSEEERAKRHPYVFLPFGEGPRNCIGMRFGLMQTKVGLAMLLKRYKFTLNERTVEPIVLDPKSFLIAVKNGIWLNAKKIN